MMADVVSRKKPLIWITIIGIIITVPVAYLAIKWTRSSLLLTLHDRALDELKVQMAHVQSEMDHRHTITRIVGRDERVLAFMRNPQDPDNRIQVNRYLKRFKDTAGSIAYLLDTEGKVLASGNWDMPDTFVGHDLSFRPYFKASIKGKDAQYVAVGIVSHRLGYYISIPIHVDGKIKGVVVTKTDPHKLIMSQAQHSRPLIITDAENVTIISSSAQYLYNTLSMERDSPPKHISRFRNIEIKPITTDPIEKVGRLRLITLPTAVDLNKRDETPARQYLLTDTPIPSVGWKANILWPVDDLDTPLMQRRLISALMLILAWLLAFYSVERWQHMKQIQEHAFRDPLTRLYTRLYMLESAPVLLAAHDRNSIAGVSAIMFDLDRFKEINDRYGHSAGDNVLVKVAGVISKECRESDIPIRYGGEEFLIFVPTGDHGKVLQLAERIRHQIKQQDIKLAGNAVQITISGGIAAHMPGEPLERLIDRADHMMYLAKQNGRDQVTKTSIKELDLHSPHLDNGLKHLS